MTKTLLPGHVDLTPATIRIIRGEDKPVKPTVTPPFNPFAVTRPGPLQPGDGDIIVPRRPGSDHSHIKSRGYPC